jgi:hypothetical protein
MYVIMEDNEDEDYDNNFPGNTKFSAFDNDIGVEEPKGEAADGDLKCPLIRGDLNVI